MRSSAERSKRALLAQMAQASGRCTVWLRRSTNSLLVKIMQTISEQRKRGAAGAYLHLTAPLIFIKFCCCSHENDLSVYDFCGSIADVIAPPDPFQRVTCLEFFSNIFLFGQSHYNVIEQCLRLQFNLYKIAVQCPGSEQIVIAYTVMLFQVPPVSLSPNLSLIHI